MTLLRRNFSRENRPQVSRFILCYYLPRQLFNYCREEQRAGFARGILQIRKVFERLPGLAQFWRELQKKIEMKFLSKAPPNCFIEEI
jgi:hypothetical protein